MFEIDDRLEADSIPIIATDDVLVRLMNDKRYPWVVLVPRVADAKELHDLAEEQFISVLKLARSIGSDMGTIFGADKINTAAIGNIVQQLHVHVVARTSSDDAWPNPVWGNGTPIPLENDEKERRVDSLMNSPSLQRLAVAN